MPEKPSMYEFMRKRATTPNDFISTGVEKLDVLLEGGIPPGFFTLILSAPGSGSEILAKQIAASGKTLLFTTSETKEEIINIMKRFGWSAKDVDIVDIASKYTKSVIISQEKRVSIYQKRSGLDLKELIAEGSGTLPSIREGEPDFLAMIGDKITEPKLPPKIILYSLDFFLDQYPHNEVLKTIHALKIANLRNRGALFVILTKGVYGELFERRMEGIADCVIELEILRKGTSFDRYLAVKKMKNYARKIGMARYTIDKDGFVLEMIERIL
jgi:KaiC/GvpD/RAD55 family RecA-like ATPase